MQLGLDVNYDDKHTNKDQYRYNAYQGVEVDVSHMWLLGKGQFLVSGVSYEVDRYDEPDTAISIDVRRDQILRAHSTYGLPLGLLFSHVLPEMVLKDLTGTFGFEQTRAYSNLANYTYNNSQVTGMISKRVDF